MRARSHIPFRFFAPSRPPPSPQSILRSSPFTTRAFTSSTIPSLRAPLLFSLGVGTFAFSAAALSTNLDTESRLAALTSSSAFFRFRDVDSALVKSRFQDSVDRARGFLTLFPVAGPEGWRWPVLIAEKYVNTSEAQRTCLGIIALQVVVFGVWQVRGLRRVQAWLWHDPLRPGRTATLLTSVFSHKNTLHLLFNSIALYSFGPSVINQLQSSALSNHEAGARSTSRYEFLGLYICAGLFASLTSHLWSIKVLLPKMRTILPSLGASGAIYGCLAITGLSYPDASVSLIFLPFIPIPIGTAFWSMVALDTFGLLRGWRVFDHAAHLGGAAAGVLYYQYGHQVFEKYRAWLQQWTIPYTTEKEKERAGKGR